MNILRRISTGRTRGVTALVLATFVCGCLQQTTSALTESGLKSIVQGYAHYDPTEGGGCATASSVANSPSGSFLPSGPGAVLEDHVLPALVGGAGLEEKAVRVGGHAELAPGTSNPGANLALAPNGLTDQDVQYYFNMRWRYATWDWRGDSTAGPESVDWYTQKVRKVLVTNVKDPANLDDDVSIVVSIVESGPAPWTGVQEPENIQAPEYWSGYVDGTPPQYKGRVSGLSPDAWSALGSSQELMRTPTGGVDLYYQWAPNQSIAAGTKYTGKVDGAVTTQQLLEGQGKVVACLNGGVAGEFTFYSQYDPEWRYKCYGPEAESGGCVYSNLGEAGCGPSALAMVATTMLGRAIRPPEVAQYSYEQGWYHGRGTDWGLFNEGVGNWGLTSTAIGTNLDKAVSALKNGALVIASGEGATPYTGSGHLIVLRGVTPDGKILIGDSNTDPPAKDDPNNTREWPESQILQGLKGLWIIAKK